MEALDCRTAAETDVLTGLANRRAWDRSLTAHAERFALLGDPMVVVMADLDNLKKINDGQGHAAGDEYLRRAARALRASVRSTDVLARLGGDEFGILLPNCEEHHAVARVAALSRALRAVGVAGSFGWAAATLPAGIPGALVEADEAMYAAKRRARTGGSRLAVAS